MSSVNGKPLVRYSVRLAFLSLLVILVSGSSIEAPRPHLNLDSVPAHLSLHTPFKLAPKLQPVQSSSEPDPSSHPRLDVPVVNASRELRLESAEPPNDIVLTSLSNVLSAVFGPGSVQTSQETVQKTMGAARPEGDAHVIGYSFEKRPITSYRFGNGHRTVIFIGGIHGGYEWNTILLAYQAINYFTDHPEAVPEDVTLIIIPAANPDGQYASTGKEGLFELSNLASDTTAGRFNGRDVDLNRNWDCGWESTAWWRDRAVSGGKKPFSEPESRALRDFFLQQKPEGVIFWHSKAGAVYAGGCQELFQPARYLAEVYGSASGYPVAADGFTYYEVSGDASDWLSTQSIPSFTVELVSHDQIEWSNNLAGMIALLDHFNYSDREAHELE